MAWIAILACTVLIYSIQKWNRNRATTIEDLILTPNCLLTRFPILFIGGKSSLFYHHHYWNTLPDFLTQHGYDIYNFDLAIRNSKQRQQEIKNTFLSLGSQKQKYHLFIDSTSLQDVESLLNTQDFDCITSVTYLHSTAKHAVLKNQTLLKGLKVPIEEFMIPASQKIPFAWKLHHFIISDTDRNPAALGLASQHELPQIRAKLLQRAVELAERDLSQTGRPYDEPQERSY